MPSFPDYPSEHDLIPGVVSVDAYDKTDRWDYRSVVRVWHLDDKKFGLRITASWGGRVGHEPSVANVTVEEGHYENRPSPKVKVYFCDPCGVEKVAELVTELARKFAPTTTV